MARQALIIAHQPSYERRHNQIESIFLSAIDGYSNQLVFPEHLQQLIVSETAIFDVLPQFFYHENEIVRFSALEVYVQRAYTAYIIECIESLEVGCSKASGWFLTPTEIRKMFLLTSLAETYFFLKSKSQNLKTNLKSSFNLVFRVIIRHARLVKQKYQVAFKKIAIRSLISVLFLDMNLKRILKS